MRETVSREIDGHEYTVTQLSFSDGRRVMMLLTKKLGPGFVLALGGVVSSAMSKGGGLLDADTKDLADGIVRLIQDLDEADLVTLETAFGKSTTVRLDGRTPYLVGDALGAHFRGRLLTYFKWLAFACEVNYADFFDAVRGLKGSAPDTSPA